MSYQSIFPEGQPFKCLYAAYAIDRHTIGSHTSAKDSLMSPACEYDASGPDQRILLRALDLVSHAIKDPCVIDGQQTNKLNLSHQLVNLFFRLLQGKPVFPRPNPTEPG